MLESLSIFCPAKINLGLKVSSKRPDGYHDLQSIFMTVPLFDRLDVQLAGHSGTCRVDCEPIGLPPRNTISAAYDAFKEVTGFDGGVKVHIEKHIPIGGGLGGGSSNAASFIWALGRLLGIEDSPDWLTLIAGKAGSDTFFFAHALASASNLQTFEPFAAVVEGRGDKVKAIPCRKDFYVLLSFPDISVSTVEAYAMLDRRRQLDGFLSESIESIDFYPEKMYNLPVRDWKFENDFTVVLCARSFEIENALQDMKSSGADFCDVTGSGSCVFGVFEDAQKARQAEVVLGKKRGVALCSFV